MTVAAAELSAPNSPGARVIAGLLLAGSLTGLTARAADAPAAETVATPVTENWYVERRSYGTRRDTEPPPYVKPLDQTWLGRTEALQGVDWLDVGLDYRVRYEFRDNDFRRAINTIDQPFQLRTRLFLGIRDRFDPFRLVVEIEDARRVNSDFDRDVRDYNLVEPIQLYGELHFKTSPLWSKPLAIKFGRQAFEYLDRRLLARNEFRNTTNNFEGIRVILGEQRERWQVDALLVQPILRDVSGYDRRDKANTLIGAIGDWRGWSKIITAQPFYLVLKQDGSRAASGVEREIHSIGFRGYGIVGTSGFDYDFSYIRQTGNDGPRKHEAIGGTVEIGYSFDAAWKPRLSLAYNHATGDDLPNDLQSGRFERLFGFARPFSQNDYFQFENLEAPKLRLELTPSKTLQFDAGFNLYAVESPTDRWNNASRRDPSGNSGSHIGHEFDARTRWRLTPQVQTELLYAYFKAGEFARNTGRGGTSNLVFVQVMVSAF